MILLASLFRAVFGSYQHRVRFVPGDVRTGRSSCGVRFVPGNVLVPSTVLYRVWFIPSTFFSLVFDLKQLRMGSESGRDGWVDKWVDGWTDRRLLVLSQEQLDDSKRVRVQSTLSFG